MGVALVVNFKWSWLMIELRQLADHCISCVRLDGAVPVTALILQWNCTVALEIYWSQYLHWNGPEIALGWLRFNCCSCVDLTTAKLHWNCSETALNPRWNGCMIGIEFSQIALKLLWNCSKTALKLLWNDWDWLISETALNLLWNGCRTIWIHLPYMTRSLVRLLWNCSEIALKSAECCSEVRSISFNRMKVVVSLNTTSHLLRPPLGCCLRNIKERRHRFSLWHQHWKDVFKSSSASFFFVVQFVFRLQSIDSASSLPCRGQRSTEILARTRQWKTLRSVSAQPSEIARKSARKLPKIFFFST